MLVVTRLGLSNIPIVFEHARIVAHSHRRDGVFLRQRRLVELMMAFLPGAWPLLVALAAWLSFSASC